MKNFVQSDENITVAAPRTLSSGDFALVGHLYGCAIDDAASGDDVVLVTEGVFDITALSTDTGTVGTKMYWDDTNHYATTTATSNTYIGVLTVAKASGDTTARIRLSDPT